MMTVEEAKIRLAGVGSILKSKYLITSLDMASTEAEAEEIKLQYEALQMAIAALERSRWIPVSKRLPELYELVVVTHNTGVINLARPDPFSDWTKAGIAHWMPLPEPPGYDRRKDDAK